MAEALKKIDLVLLLGLILLLVFFGIRGDRILNKDSSRDFINRNRIALTEIRSFFPDSDVSYLRSYYRSNGSKKLISEYLVLQQSGEIQRILGTWENSSYRIFSTD